ncbi:MAG: hypothetical protein U1E62_03975 [Alsobacter sp.]
MRIVVVAEAKGSAEVLLPLCLEWRNRGAAVSVFAVGTASEAAGFAQLPYVHSQHPSLVEPELVGADLLLVGLTGSASPEREAIALARARDVPVVGVLDNVDRITKRLSPGPLPDLVLLSADSLPSAAAEALVADHGAEGRRMAEAIRVVGNLRRDLAAHRRSQFDDNRRREVLAAALAGTSDSAVIEQTITGLRQPVVLFSQTIAPTAPYWRSYGVDAGEPRILYSASLIASAKTLGSLVGRDDVTLIMRPHPAELSEPARHLCIEFGAALSPPGSCDSLDLALAAGRIVSPPSSMLDQGAFLRVRTVALLYETPGPFHFESLRRGQVLAVDRIEDTPGALDDLLDTSPRGEQRWTERLDAGHRGILAPQVVDLVERWMVHPKGELTIADN